MAFIGNDLYMYQSVTRCNKTIHRKKNRRWGQNLSSVTDLAFSLRNMQMVMSPGFEKSTRPLVFTSIVG